MRTSTLSLFCLVAVAVCTFGNDANDTQGNQADYLPVLPEKVCFYLYTQKNPTYPQQLFIKKNGSVSDSNFNPSDPTRFIIHGWMSDSKQEVNTLLRDAYLSRGPSNIIVVDWIDESVNVYELSVLHVPGVGEQISKFIDFMVENGWINLKNLTIVGHSLGAQIAGIAARSVKSGQVHTVVGLDPAQREFGYNNSRIRLRSTDAYYVESIQTTAGGLSYIDPIGKATFYPNGGVFQPGCLLDLAQTCGHFRAYIYFADAIRYHSFPSIKCNSCTDATQNKCGTKFSQTVRMGDPGNADVASGVFYVPVNPVPPYSYYG